MNTSSTVEFTDSGDALGHWWQKEPDGRILCQLCPRACRLKAGDRGFCFVRVNRDDRMVLDTYGRSTGFCIDPIEKKPLNHFLPGTPVLSFGTAGCNLGCKFCQNWDISKSREVARLSQRATPDDIAAAAVAAECRSVAFTYNDPVIWAEYAIDTAAACRSRNVRSVAVTAGYITPEARVAFFESMDAANIDLKAFTEDFYFKLTGAHLDPVLDTIRYAVQETNCWVELTNLIIPHANDQHDEFRRMCDWIVENVGPDVPIHFTAFHPDFKMRDRNATSHESLLAARQIASAAGIRYAYVGNVHDVANQSTYCPQCDQRLIERDWHQLGEYRLVKDRCDRCGFKIAGRFEATPGNWGRRRQPIQIHNDTDDQRRQPRLPIATDATRSREADNTMASVSGNSKTDFFNDEQLKAIQHAAGRFVSAVVRGQSFDLSSELGDLAASEIAGVYVTLKRGETLRGCCGLQGKSMRLDTALADAATRTAKHDPRMPPIVAVELPHLTLGISVLGAARPIGVAGEARADAIEIGRQGLRIRYGNNVGLLLPVVAVERSWNARQFLDAVCQKAGLPAGTWLREDAVVEVFDGVSYTAAMESLSIADVPAFSADQLTRLRDWVAHNLVALESGATPFYYATDVSDASVSGILLQVGTQQQSPLSFLQMNIREGIPLQASLFQLTQSAANTFAGVASANALQVDVGVMSSVVHHGIESDHDLRGIDCRTRSLLVMDGQRWAFGFDRADSPQSLIRSVLGQQKFRTNRTQVYSAVCDATCDRLVASSGPRPETSPHTRAPAVAGTFYPADDAAREAEVDQLLRDLPEVDPQNVAAAMVPHAGLRFSGRIAADVWRRISLPSSVLIIGPKHTADGMDWAIAPHETWQLSSTASMPGDPALANRIATYVPEFDLDAAAHRSEHGIEVQLPLLYRLAPQTRVAGIAMAGGSAAQLRDAAKSLARCLAEMDEPPLLVISSDMNHFADDAENRRRDRIALDAFAKNDPEALLSTCHQHNISMCGQIPAALVLMTLQELSRPIQYTEIAYGTSGDVTGDRSRVVGYAGVLL